MQSVPVKSTDEVSKCSFKVQWRGEETLVARVDASLTEHFTFEA